MKIIVVGANGFVGPHLIRRLREEFPGADIIGTYLQGTDTTCLQSVGIRTVSLDITDTGSTRDFIDSVKPDQLVNLAAQSSVGFSWKDPVLTFRVNVIGTLNILQGVRDAGIHSRCLLIGSSEEYQSGSSGLTESDEIDPANPYGISKMTQERLGRLYSDQFDIPVIMTRSFNHTGPGQLETFVIPDWCRQIVRIERGECRPEISVGNLSVRRDFSHVADIVGDYAILMKSGAPGEIYNVGSGVSYGLDDILRRLIDLSDADIKIVVDQDKYRPAENDVIGCDRSKIAAVGGVEYRSLDETLADTLNYWRRVAE